MIISQRSRNCNVPNVSDVSDQSRPGAAPAERYPDQSEVRRCSSAAGAPVESGTRKVTAPASIGFSCFVIAELLDGVTSYSHRQNRYITISPTHTHTQHPHVEQPYAKHPYAQYLYTQSLYTQNLYA